MQYDNWELIDFVRTIPNWKEIFKNEYFMDMREDEHFTLIDYNQIFTPICHLTNQCRGVIVDHVKKTIVRRGFYRFFNYGQPEAASLDLNNLIIEEKVDGSFIGVFWNEYTNLWQIGTRGTIDGSAPLQTPDVKNNINTYRELVLQTLLDAHERDHVVIRTSRFFVENPSFIDTLEKLYNLNHTVEMQFQALTRGFNKNETYIFEIVSKFNRIVVPYIDNDLYYLCTIDNETGVQKKYPEIEDHYLVKNPKIYGYETLQEVINISKELPFSKEGYVVRDNLYNRIKIKSLQYLLCHKIRGNGINFDRAIDLFLSGEYIEFLSYFPEFSSIFQKVQLTIENIEKYIKNKELELSSKKFISKKDFALYIKDWYFSSYFFMKYDGKINSIDNYIKSINKKIIIESINYLY